MKNKALRLETFAVFEAKSSIKNCIVFFVNALLIFLFASIQKMGFVMALAVFCGLVYARQNILVLAPCFIVAVFVFSLEWMSIVFAIAPIVLLIGLYIIFFKLKKNVPLWAVALCALLGIAPYIVCQCLFLANYIFVGISCLVLVFVVFCAGISAYAFYVRGILHKMTTDETICTGVLLAIMAYALMRVGAYGFYAYDLILAFCILFCCCCFRADTTLLISLLFGLGATAYTGDISSLANAVILAGAAVIFSPFTKWSSALAMLAVQALMCVLKVYDGAVWQSAVMVAVGVCVAVAIPKQFIAKIKSLSQNDDRRAYSGIVNRRGRELATKLYSASDVFFDLSKSLDDMANDKGEFSAQKLAKEVAKNYCGKCKNREACFSALGQDTSGIILPMADASLNRGKVTILDMPPFITSRCTNMHSLANVINSSAQTYKQRQDASNSVAICKSMMSQQFAGVSLVLDSLAQNCSEQVSFASEDVEIIKGELLKHNIVASEVVVSGEDGAIGITLLVRECDVQKAILPRVVGKCLKGKFEVVRISEKGEQKLVYLQSAPLFEVAYGISQEICQGNDVCGDSQSVLCPSRTRRLFAICDGMGHGEKASKASQNALKMIESFYRAGIESKIVLNLVNKLLKLSLDDTFSTLDIAVIDTQTGTLDIIKLGASSSFIVRKDNIEVLSCTNTPVGIVDNVESETSRYQLYDGDMLVMMSDGVYDVLENKGVAELVDSIDTQNPQVLADSILQKAKECNANDDCTVIAMRLFAV